MSGATVKDIEFLSTNTDRSVSQTGLVMSGVDSRLIGCTVHDLHGMGALWFDSGGGEISECLFFSNGYRDEYRRGYCIYTHNNQGGRRYIRRNILLAGMGEYVLHAYSANQNAIRDYSMSENIIAGNPVQVGGGLGVSGLEYTSNAQYQNGCFIGRYSENVDCTVSNNVFLDNASLEISGFETVVNEGNITVAAQAYVACVPCQQTTRKRAHLAIFNPQNLATFTADLTVLNLSDGPYLLVNAQNIAESRTITVLNNSAVIPMRGWTTALYIGENAQMRTITTSRFGTFILR